MISYHTHTHAQIPNTSPIFTSNPGITSPSESVPSKETV